MRAVADTNVVISGLLGEDFPANCSIWLLACSVAAEAELLISGDHHLLELGRHRGIQIVTVQEAVRILTSRG